MRRALICLPLVLALGCPTEGVEPPTPAPEVPLPDVTSLVDEVDVFVGTGFEGIGIGSTFPGPALPFGLARPGPDTQGSATPIFTHCSGYSYNDDWIAGFSHLRPNGMGVPDYGVVAVMPTVGWDDGKRTASGHRALKDFASETGEVGYYSVEMESGSASVGEPIRVELTTGLRASLHRVTFPASAGDDARLIIDLSHTIPDVDFTGGALDPAGEAGDEWEGWMHFDGPYSERHGGEDVYVVMRMDRAPIDHSQWDEDGALGAQLRFDASTDTELRVAVGLSFVDIAGARANLAADLPADVFDFESTRAAAREAWTEVMDTIQLGGGGETERAIFASSLYHAMLMPTLFTDSDGRYLDFDGTIETAEGWTFYTDFSLWDTYRTVHPLYDFVVPELEDDFLRSLYDMYEAVGKVPRWPLGSGTTGGMIGDSAANVFAGAMAKGIGLESVGAVAALEALEVTAAQRSGQGSYFDLGYVAADMSGGSVSHTLEYSWNDAALAVLAEVAGDTTKAEELRARSRNWRNHWDADSGFLRPMDSNGVLTEPWWPDVQLPAYVEGTAWQYMWMAPHDIPGYAELMGSNEAAVERLNSFFRAASAELADHGPSYPTAYYWHGNEPVLNASYLFAQLGRPDLTVQWSRWAEDTLYDVGPAGLPGNDDGGTMGAWYVWSSLGLYPIAGTARFILGAPRFPQATMRVQDATLTVKAPGLTEALAAADDGVVTVARVELNGVVVDGVELDWSSLRDGGELVFFIE
ncbi:MAG: GH92 family glycosyl hydrolase [Deltaproteobacteria bacterium]|nr:GH92 family glycosyl hydrolase [Deltaproteobacteria bacterium]